MNPHRKVLFYLCGRSGSGKDSLLKELLKMIPDLKPDIPLTTRDKRVGEQNGVEYWFMTQEAFDHIRLDTKKLLHYQVYHTFDKDNKPKDAYYGYPKPTCPFEILTGPWDVLMDIRTKHRDTDTFRFIPIYVTTQNEYDILERMIKRELKNPVPKIKEVARRFCADQEVYPKNKGAEIYLGKENVIYNEVYTETLGQLVTLIRKYIEEEKANV